MGNIGKEIARPFEYIGKTGGSETHEKGRHNIGGQVTGATKNVKLNAFDKIVISNFENHLRGKGIPEQAVTYFQCLKFVGTGHR